MKPGVVCDPAKKGIAMKKLALFLTLVAVLSCGAYLYRHRFATSLHAPNVPVARRCATLKPGMRRIGQGYGFQVDVPLPKIGVSEGMSDAPPLKHVFALTPHGSPSALKISFGAPESEGVDPLVVFSKHLEKRRMLDDKGHLIGEDAWGYVGTGERFRRVHVGASIDLTYDFVNQRDSELFDEIIDSLCILPPPTP